MNEGSTTPAIVSRVSTSRRRLLLVATLFSATVLGGRCALSRKESPSDDLDGPDRDLANFRTIFGDPALKARFRPFLIHVFHLFPEPELTALISRLVAEHSRDPAVYRELAAGLDAISPVLAGPRYALPALRHQKAVMAEQTAKLLGPTSEINGYFELGSHGRYYDALEERLAVEGPLYTSALGPPGASLEDIVDRGQLSRVGSWLPWSDYQPIDEAQIASESLDLVTVYIGLHHAREEQRLPFLRSLARVLRPGGSLILRDHDVQTREQEHLVSLAHDVFNAGTRETWRTNATERRNFYPLDTILDLAAQAGLVAGSERLLQDGDPTLNTLVRLQKA